MLFHLLHHFRRSELCSCCPQTLQDRFHHTKHSCSCPLRQGRRSCLELERSGLAHQDAPCYIPHLRLDRKSSPCPLLSNSSNGSPRLVLRKQFQRRTCFHHRVRQAHCFLQRRSSRHHLAPLHRFVPMQSFRELCAKRLGARNP